MSAARFYKIPTANRKKQNPLIFPSLILMEVTKENGGFTSLGVCGGNMGKEVKLINNHAPCISSLPYLA